MKQNDWIVAVLNNPTFTVGDFQNIADMNLDNTQLLSKEDYLKSSFIRENPAFKNKDGQFSESLFNQFYQNASQKFSQFSTEDAVNDYEYSIWDPNRPLNAKTKDIGFNISTVKNPEHIKIGIEGINKVTLSDKSRRELAQNSKIYDPSTNTYLDKSVNDLSLFNNPIEYFKSWFDEPLVYATYDEDTIETDPITGKQIKHLKGEWKVNEDGEYYTEKLNGRSLLGKQVVSVEDYITSEDSASNRYDFFDADGLDKSPMGTIVKNLVAALPIFIPYVGTAYSGLLIAREMSKTIPMMYGIINGLSGNDVNDNQLLNTIAAYGEKFTGSTTDYAQENTFALENFLNMASDVALQWGQQSTIANTFSKLTSGGRKALDDAYIKASQKYLKEAEKSINDRFAKRITDSELVSRIGTAIPGEVNSLVRNGQWAKSLIGEAALKQYLPAAQKIFENRMKAGQDLSLLYMALISNTDVYESILEKGGTPFEAAAIALGSMIGMYSVDKYLGLGEMFFQKSGARQAIRESARHNADLYMAGRNVAEDMSTKKGIIGAIQKGIANGRKTVNDYLDKSKYGGLSLIGKSLGEGLEEVSEEFVADASKSIGELLGQLGYFSQTDYGAWDNTFDRYAMSFLGGSIGGAMFGAKQAWDNRNVKIQQFQNDINYLIGQGKKDELINEFKKLRDSGQLGSKTLSYDVAEDGSNTYLTASDKHKSQADSNYEGLVSIINQLDMILNNNNINLSEDESFDKLVQGEYRSQALTDFLKGDNAENVKEVSYISRYQEDLAKLKAAIENKEIEIQNYISSVADPSKRNDPEFKQNLDKLLKEKQELLDQRDYLFGEGSLGYVEKTLFAMDPILNKNFGTFNFNQFVRSLFGKSVSDLNESELTFANEQFKKLPIKQNLDEAFKLFKDMGGQINPSIQNLQLLNVDREIKHIQELRKNNPFDKLLSDSDKLDTESDAEYQQLFVKKEDETDEDFKKRQESHIKAVQQYNLDNIYKWIQDFLQQPITSTDFRYLVSRIKQVKSQVLRQALNGVTFPDDNQLTQDIRGIIQRIGIEDKNKLYEAIQNRIQKSTENYFSKYYDNKVGLDQDKIVTNELTKVSNLSPEEKVAIGIPADYVLNSGVITNLDIYAYIQYQKASKGWDFDQTKEDLNNTGWSLEEDSPEAVAFYAEALLDPTKLEDEEANNIVSLTEEQYESEIEDLTQKRFDDFKYKLDNNFINKLENDEIYKTLVELESSQFVNNPVVPILEQVSKQSPNKNTNIEQFLQDIYMTFSNGDSYQDFQLSEDQLRILNQIQQDLETAAAFVYAASSSDKPIGHNKQINQFARNHRDVFSNYIDLPEIDSKIADFILGEIAAYKREIQQWIDVHNANTQETEIKFIKAEQALNSGIIEYFKVYRNDFKLSKGIDLLEGYENLTLDNSLSSVIILQELLFNNYNKAIANGYTLTQILDEILPKMTKMEGILDQKTAKLDENFTYSNFTDYDKFQLFISSIGASTVNYYRGLDSFLKSNQNMAPISIQEYVSKLAYVQNQNPKLVNNVLEYIKQKTGTRLDIAENTQILTGLGGSGKTFAAARLNLGEGENTWLSGPEQSQIDNLQNSLPKGTSITIEDLFRTIFGGDIPDLSTLYTVVKNNGISTVVIKPEFIPKAIQNPPRNLVIDEATHLSTAQVLILSKFCKVNNINLLLIGDDHQNGYSQKNIENIESNVLLAWRAPDLYLSLRNNNVHKSENQKPIINMLDTLGNAPNSSFEAVSQKVFNEQFENLTFKYYNKERLSGDIIVNSLSTELINKIPKDGKVGFVGVDSSPYYKQLKDLGYDIEVMSPSQIQGREFNYVVIDQNWDFKQDNSWRNTGVDMINFLKNLYTMISRSREATILINNGLSKIIKNVESNYNGTLSAISRSVQKFRERRLPEIEQALQKVSKLQQVNKSDQGEQPITNIARKTQYTSVNGSVTNGQYESTTDSDGFTHINYTGQSQAKIHFSNDDVGLTIEDITGPRDSYYIQENYDNVKTDTEQGNITIDKVTIRPDGTISIQTDNEITIEGEPAKKIYDHFFKEGLPTYTRTGNKQSIKIGGEQVTKEDLEEEHDPEKNGTENNNEEASKSKEDENNAEQQIGSPIRVYSNVSYSGIDTISEVWTNNEDSKTDLGIFIRPGQEIKPGNKLNYIRKVLELKNLFEFGFNYWDRLPLETKRLFSKDKFENAKYFIKIEDPTDFNRLIGLTEGTGLTNEGRPINGKVVKLIVKIQGNDGVEYTLSLGGLNNPETWEQNRKIISDAIKAKIDRKEGNIEELTKYLNALPDIIKRYQEKINTWTQQNQEIELKNKPVFHGDTLITSLETAWRLENVNSTSSPYASVAPVQVTSPIYTNVGEIEGINPKLRGKPIRFMSRNLLLNPSELKDIYLAQLQDPTLPKIVRMDVLNTLGVSFKSLYQDKYTELYKVSNGITTFTLPFESGPMAIRMYISMWNFRAGLLRFLDSYNQFLSSSNLTESQVEELCKLDNDMYNQFKQENEVVDESSYRNQIPEDVKSKLKLIWDFNDSLASYCKEFRLGYSSGHGAYLRKLTNLDTKFYEHPESVIGVYINPSIARQYKDVIDTIFNNIIDKIIPVNQSNHKKYITTNLSSLENWFSDLKQNSEIKLEFTGKDSSEDIKVSVKDMSVLNALPSILIRMGKLLNIYNQNTQDLVDYLLENKDGRYVIKFNDQELDWMSVLNGISNPVATELNGEFRYQQPGIIPLKMENGVKIGTKDSRLDDMFSLMFHGMISTKIPNDFTRNDIRATYAYFKYGFFVDAFIQALPKNGERQNIEHVVTNPKFFASNLATMGTVITIDLDENTTPKLEIKTEEKPQENPVIVIHNQINNQLQNSGIEISNTVLTKQDSVNKYITMLKSKITKKFNNYFKGNDNTPIDQLIESISYSNGQIIFTKFTDRPELKGHTIAEFTRGVNSIEVTLDNGTKYTIQSVAGNIIFTSISEPKDVILQVGNIRSEIKGILNRYSDENVEDGISTQGDYTALDELFRILDDGLGVNDIDTISPEKFNRILNQIQEHLKDYNEEDWYNDIIQDLSNYKNRICANT